MPVAHTNRADHPDLPADLSHPRRAHLPGVEQAVVSPAATLEQAGVSSAHSLAQQALFQGGAFLRIASLVVGDAILRRNLTLDGSE